MRTVALVTLVVAYNDLLPVTVTVIRLPTSAATVLYEILVAPLITVVTPARVVRFHTYVTVVGSTGVQEPLTAVRVVPTVAAPSVAPLMVGTTVVNGEPST